MKSNMSSEEISIEKIFNLIKRNRSLIISSIFLFFLISLIFGYSRKKIWEGEFQIVIRDQKSNSDSSKIPEIDQILNISSIGGTSAKLRTEVGILESPSVLLPIFDYIKLEKNLKSNSYTFNLWKNKNLDIELKKGTSILNIAYRDDNKKIIRPVLNKISEAYQDYSGKTKRRGLELTQKYLNEQINIYKDRSSKSIKIAQSYAIDQDLTSLDLGNRRGIAPIINPLRIPNVFDYSRTSVDLIDNVGIEVARVRAANEIRKIDSQIEKIENLKVDKEGLVYLNLIPSDINIDLSNRLNAIEVKLLNYKSKYTNEAELIKKAEQEKALLINLIVDRSIDFLKVKRIQAEAVMESAKRPKDVVLKYKELVREAGRDENILIELEDQLRLTQLEESRYVDPWELITKPTVKNSPVAPSKSKLAFLGIILGGIIGVLISFIKEKKSGYIFEEEELVKNLKANIIEKLNLENMDSYLSSGNIFTNTVLKLYENKNTRIIVSPNLDKVIIEKIKKSLLLKNQSLKFSDNIFNIEEDMHLLLLTSLKSLRKDDIQKLSNQLKILKTKLDGIIIIN